VRKYGICALVQHCLTPRNRPKILVLQSDDLSIFSDTTTGYQNIELYRISSPNVDFFNISSYPEFVGPDGSKKKFTFLLFQKIHTVLQSFRK